MIRDAFFWLLSTFVVDPAIAEFNSRLGEVRAPLAVTEQVQACAVAAPGALAEKATANLAWGVRTVVSVAIGATGAKSVIAEATPGCAAAMAAVRPLLQNRGS